MKFVRSAKAWSSLAVWLVAAGLSHGAAREQSLGVDQIVRQAVARTQQAETTAVKTPYTYTRVSLVEELDATGKVKERKEKTYQVSFRGGATEVKLLEVNGRAPAAADVKKQSENEMN